MNYNKALFCLLLFILPVFFYCFNEKDYFLGNESSYFLEDERNNIAIFERSSHCVVNIRSTKYARLNFFSYNIMEVPAGSGSGFVWDNKGHIVTNYHVIRNADKLVITFSNGKSYRAEVVGKEPKKDIAVLYVKEIARTNKKNKFHVFNIANSSDLRVGQKTIAFGSPFGLDQTMTTGIISATGRSILGVGRVRIKGMIQTDASINLGNSGGPLLNSRAELIGMNTMIYSKTGGSIGIGFAVPSKTIERVVSQIIKYGRVIQPGLGFEAFDDSVLKKLGKKGVLVRDVVPGGSAEKAGLEGTYVDANENIIMGDIIVAVNKQRVKNYSDLYNILELKKVGQTVTVTVFRNENFVELRIKLIDVHDT